MPRQGSLHTAWYLLLLLVVGFVILGPKMFEEREAELNACTFNFEAGEQKVSMLVDPKFLSDDVVCDDFNLGNLSPAGEPEKIFSFNETHAELEFALCVKRECRPVNLEFTDESVTGTCPFVANRLEIEVLGYNKGQVTLRVKFGGEVHEFLLTEETDI